MEYRTFGKTELEVSEITLGTWAFGHPSWWGKEPDDEESISVMTEAVEKGINHIATAKYGNAEEVVGRGLKGIRDKVYIADSTGASSLSFKEMEEKLDETLKALQTDYLDFYYLHYPHEGFCKMIENMDTVRKKGKVKYLGVSNFSQPQLTEALKVASIEFIQSPYSLLWREIEPELAPFCEKKNIAVTTYSSIAQGLLTGKYKSYDDVLQRKGALRDKAVLFQEDIFPHSLEVVKFVEEIAEKYRRTPGQVALRWLLHQDSVTTVIVGARNISQLEDNLGATDWDLEEEDWKRLDEKGKEVAKLLDYSASMWGNTYNRGME
jgi:aryl-alcohol dehydrogenase-like predicted oxidoreductase